MVFPDMEERTAGDCGGCNRIPSGDCVKAKEQMFTASVLLKELVI